MNSEKSFSHEKLQSPAVAQKLGNIAAQLEAENQSYWADYCYDLQTSFRSDLQKSQMTREKFEKYYESDLGSAYEAFFKSEKNANIAPFSKNGAPLELEFQRNLRPENTIEAYSGNFFNSRAIELENAAQQIGQEEYEEIRGLITDFSAKVINHVEWRYQATRTAEQLRQRMYCHNQVIKSLNSLNAKAKQYGTAPFTPRNFMHCTYEEQRDFDRNEENRALFDRGVVEAFYSNAFSKEIKKVEREHQYDY